MAHSFSARSFGPRQQQGAVLYVALIMLILLALIGIAGMQVASMQERMASNYRAVNVAFQNAEAVVRRTERSVESVANRTALDSDSPIQSGDIGQRCDDGFDPGKWGDEQSYAAVPAVNVRQIDQCIEGEGDISMGRSLDRAIPIYQITSYAADDSSNASSSAVVDTVFKL